MIYGVQNIDPLLIWINVNGFGTLALIDTEATISIIISNFADEIQPSISSPTNMKANSVSGHIAIWKLVACTQINTTWWIHISDCQFKPWATIKVGRVEKRYFSKSSSIKSIYHSELKSKDSIKYNLAALLFSNVRSWYFLVFS